MINFGNLFNFQCETAYKRQYVLAEYLSPEQIENQSDPQMAQVGEMWNLGVIMYVLYQGEYPFSGFSDEDIINEITNKPNYWRPQWKEGTSQ